jgi:hypothetical protein
MALRFCDSFGHYSLAQMVRKWTGFGAGGTGALSIVAGASRWANPAFRVGNFNVAGVVKVLSSQGAWVVGVAFKMAALPPLVAPVLGLQDSGARHMELFLDTAGHVIVSRAGTTLGTSSATVPVGAWCFLEMKVVIATSGGTYDVQLNGVNILSGVGNTNPTGTGTANTVFLGPLVVGDGRSMTWDYCDLYVCDGTGSVNNDFLGDVRVELVMPTGAGATTAWAHTGAASNWQAVSEAPADDDTSYVSTSSVGAVDTYAHGAVGAGTVFGVQLCLEARKTDTGARVIQGVVRSGGADSPGTMLPLSTSYGILTDIRETDPNTGLAWTTSGINAAEIGEKLAS